MQAQKLDIRCPKWALPREEIPIFVKMGKDVSKSAHSATVTLPSGFEIKDTINVISKSVDDGKLVVTDIARSHVCEYDYFGLIIASINPSEDLKTQGPVTVRIHMDDGTHEEQTVNARVFRPHLEISKIPDYITLDDSNTNNVKIPVKLKFSGFGDVRIRPVCTIGGNIVSATTALDDIKRLVTSGSVPDETDSAAKTTPEYVRKLYHDLREELTNNKNTRKMINAGKFDEKFVNQLCQLDKAQKDVVMDIYYKTIEYYITKMISDTLARNIGNYLQLESPASVSVPITLPVTTMTVKIMYKDLMGNEYATNEKTISINDNRTEPAGPGDVPAEISLEFVDPDESGAYHNVDTMDIEPDR